VLPLELITPLPLAAAGLEKQASPAQEHLAAILYLAPLLQPVAVAAPAKEHLLPIAQTASRVALAAVDAEVERVAQVTLLVPVQAKEIVEALDQPREVLAAAVAAAHLLLGQMEAQVRAAMEALELHLAFPVRP